MTIQAIKKELQVLPPNQLQEIQAFIEVLIREQNAGVPTCAEHTTDSITEEEWTAMEDELAGVKNGTVQTVSLNKAIQTLRS